MNAKAQINIRFDGDAPGLQTHRLSLSAFGDPLQHLLKALRRAVDQECRDSERGEGVRRFGRAGQQVDLQLASIADGCVQLQFDCMFPDNELLYSEDLAERAVTRVLTAIENEARGHASASPSVRRFLRSLPGGIAEQNYDGIVNGRHVKTVRLGRLTQLNGGAAALPRLVELSGRVMGVSFVPGKENVRIRAGDGETHTCLATTELVDKAILVRHEPVIAKTLVRHDLKRLLSIRSGAEGVEELTQDERLSRSFAQWNELLRRLSQ
jgi:hypothetical protein